MVVKAWVLIIFVSIHGNYAVPGLPSLEACWTLGEKLDPQRYGPNNHYIFGAKSGQRVRPDCYEYEMLVGK